MIYVSQWEQILGCSVHRVHREHTLLFHLSDVNDNDLMLALESVDETFVDVIDPDTQSIIEPSNLVGKTIIGVLVPYYIEGIGAIAPIPFYLDSGEQVALSAEGTSARVRMT